MKQVLRRFSIPLVLILLLSGVLPAMAQDDAPALPADCTSVSLEYWNPFTGPDGPFMGELVNAFNQSQDAINVTMTTQSDY